MARSPRQSKKPDKRLPFMLTKALHARVIECSLDENYGGKGKSLWIREAVLEYLKDEPTAEEIQKGDARDGLLDETTLLAGPPEFFETLDAKAKNIRAHLPLGKEPRGMLLRAALQFRLKNPKRFDDLVQKRQRPAAKSVGADPV